MFDGDAICFEILFFDNENNPKLIRPKLCQFVVLNLDDVDRCDGVRVN